MGVRRRLEAAGYVFSLICTHWQAISGVERASARSVRGETVFQHPDLLGDDATAIPVNDSLIGTFSSL